jgi:hypothetical protein
MRRRSRLLLALGTVLTLALASGCSGEGAEDRRSGDRVTEAEAGALADLLVRNHELGGADFVVTAPYGTAVLTLTGEVDFRRSVGRAQAVTTFPEGREDDVRTVFFTRDQVWFGDIPGLADALAAAGAADAGYLRRPVTTGDNGEPLLVDVAVEVVLNLSARSADQPGAFLGSGYTWLGQRSIDSRLTSVFSLKEGRTVAVAASSDLLIQFAAPLPGTDAEVTVTFSDHGPRRLDLPDDGYTAEAADHPRIAADFGI